MAAKLNIDIDQGADFPLGITLRNGSGEPLDLTGAEVLAQIRKGPGQPLLAEFEVNYVSRTGGQVEITLPGTTSALLAVTGERCARYDVLVTMGDGDRIRVLEGAVSINPAITEWPEPEPEEQ